MDTKRDFKHFINIGIGTVFNIVLGLLTTPIVTRLVDTADYGALSMFNTYTSMAVMILCLGLDQSLIRFYYEEDSVEYKKELITKTAWTSLSIALVVCIISFFIINRNSIVFDFKGVSLIALLLYILVQLFLRFALIILRVQYLSKLYAFMNVTNKAVYLIAVILLQFFVKGTNNLKLLIFATIISSIVPLTIAVYKEKVLWKPTIFKNTKKLKSDSILKYGFPFILSMGITTLFEALDKLSINYFCDYSEVGIYTSAVTIVNVFTIIQTTFNTMWAPMSIEHYTKAPNNKKFFFNVNELITFLMFIFGLSLIVFKDVFILLLGEKYRTASYMVPFLIFHPIMYTISETTSIGIDFKKKSYLHIIIALCACVSNGIGNILLVPIMGGRGAAISTGLSYIVFFLMRSVFGIMNYNYQPNMSKTFVMILLTLVYAFYSSFLSNYIFNLLIYIFLVFITIMLYRNTVFNIIKYIKQILVRKKV